MIKLHRFNKFAAGMVLLSVATFAFAAYANHSWGDYHWARSGTASSAGKLQKTVPLLSGAVFVWHIFCF